MRRHFVRLKLVSAGFIGAFLVLAGAAPALAADANAKLLTALDTEWSNAAVARNVDKVASFYADDAVAYPPNEPAAVGQAAARKVWAAYFADPSFEISWKTTAAGAENKTGWTVGTYQASFKSPDGKTVTENGKYVTVWRKGADGKWKAIHDIWNADAK